VRVRNKIIKKDKNLGEEEKRAKDRYSTKVKTDTGYTRLIDARQPCSKYVYTGFVLYGDRECIPETYCSEEERVVVVLISRLWDQIVNVPSWCELVVVDAH
jgi:hypothetical protein